MFVKTRRKPGFVVQIAFSFKSTFIQKKTGRKLVHPHNSPEKNTFKQHVFCIDEMDEFTSITIIISSKEKMRGMDDDMRKGSSEQKKQEPI